jgi:hypothetical protein
MFHEDELERTDPGHPPADYTGTNAAARDFADAWGVPFEATLGGAETMYPEYRKKLKTMKIPQPRIFESKFAREHAAAQAPSDKTK